MRRDCLGFTRDADDEALAADGWRWRSGGFLTCLFITCPLTFLLYEGQSPATPYPIRFLWLTAFVATGGTLALDQYSAHYLQRKTVATLLNVVVHLLCISTVCAQMFTSFSIDSLIGEEHGSWCLHATLAPNITTTMQMDRCVMALRNLCIYPILVALWMPSSRAGRKIGVGLQATVRSRGAQERGGARGATSHVCWQECVLEVPACHWSNLYVQEL